MSDEQLDRMIGALRDETREAESDALRQIRARVMTTHRFDKRRRTRTLAWVLPLAAAFVIGSAWAAGTGRLAPLFSPGEQQRPVQPVAPAMPRPRPRPLPAATSATTIAPPAETVKPIATQQAPSSSSSSDRVAIDLARYQKAHKLHFVDRNYDAALVAWDAYLGASSNGAFVVEARYNRAICLLKLGRRAEAKVALRPFADGAVAGGYRQAEARKLLDALDADAAP